MNRQLACSMPEICRFYGIIIAMFCDDHNPPHFYVRYGDYQAIITIENEVIKDELPIRALKLVLEWLEIHRAELLENWARLQKGEEPIVVEPLK